MACAQPAAKRAWRDWNIGDKIWLLEYKKQNPKTKICPRMISMLGDVRQQLTQLSLEELVQTKMQDYFRRPA
jgi:hypothetical protein